MDQFGMMVAMRTVVHVLRRKNRQRTHAQRGNAGDTHPDSGRTVHR